ncbi:protein of unknown function (plasmid) [Cupriavidus taiwanensis]|nr:protein of unknown function [Cupriavidus taiwanensis]
MPLATACAKPARRRATASDHGFAGEILQRDRGARRQRMARRHHRDDALAPVACDMQPGDRGGVASMSKSCRPRSTDASEPIVTVRSQRRVRGAEAVVTCGGLLKREVPPSWAGHFLAERQKVTKKRPAGGMSDRSVRGGFRTGFGFLA